MRKESGRRGYINAQYYLDADKVALVRKICFTATGGLLVRGSIPPNCILGITESTLTRMAVARPGSLPCG